MGHHSPLHIPTSEANGLNVPVTVPCLLKAPEASRSRAVSLCRAAGVRGRGCRVAHLLP